MALAGLAGVLAMWTLLTVTVLTFLWNRLDKRFDDIKTVMREDRAEQSRRLEESQTWQDKRLAESEARQDKQFAELKAVIREDRDEQDKRLEQSEARQDKRLADRRRDRTSDLQN